MTEQRTPEDKILYAKCRVCGEVCAATINPENYDELRNEYVYPDSPYDILETSRAVIIKAGCCCPALVIELRAEVERLREVVDGYGNNAVQTEEIKGDMQGEIDRLRAEVERLRKWSLLLLGVIDAHSTVSESCDRDGEDFCDCLKTATDKLRTALTDTQEDK